MGNIFASITAVDEKGMLLLKMHICERTGWRQNFQTVSIIISFVSFILTSVTLLCFETAASFMLQFDCFQRNLEWSQALCRKLLKDLCMSY